MADEKIIADIQGCHKCIYSKINGMDLICTEWQQVIEDEEGANPIVGWCHDNRCKCEDIPFDKCLVKAIQYCKLKDEQLKCKEEECEALKAELEQYKASKQASYEALQKKCNELELENRKLKEYQKLLEEQMKFNQSELELSLSSEINRSEFLLKEFKRVDKQKDNWREKAERYKQTLTEIKEIADAITNGYHFTNNIEEHLKESAKQILREISEAIDE